MSESITNLGPVCCVLGAQWGDEGKGKLVDILSEQYDIIARCAGGANAGHTIYIRKDDGEEQKIVFHLVPSGILHGDKICVIGNGTVIHFPTLIDELHALKELGYDYHGRLWISDRAHIIFDYHQQTDSKQEENKQEKKIGTTKRGIGPAYGGKVARRGIRVHELLDLDTLGHRIRDNAERLKKNYGIECDIEQEIVRYEDISDFIEPLVCDTSELIHREMANGKTLLLEGAQGAMLDIDHGTYPYVTSSNTTIGGAITGIGLAPQKITSSIGIVKAYTTRVGEGPFPTELNEMEGEMLRDKGGEFGATTGRPRRCGWFDAEVVKYASRLNGYTSLNVTKLDVLSGFDTLKIGYKYTVDGEEIHNIPAGDEAYRNVQVEYIEMPGWQEDITKVRKFSDLPKNAQDYVKKIEELVGVPVGFIGVGQFRDDLIVV